MIELTLTLVTFVLCLMLGVAVLVVAAMTYDAITSKPFVSHKGDKWKRDEIQQQPAQSIK